MCNLICLSGLFLAAIFAVVVYGPGGLDPSEQNSWVDVVFWGIITAGMIPAVIQMTKMYMQDFRAWMKRRRRHHHSIN